MQAFLRNWSIVADEKIYRQLSFHLLCVSWNFGHLIIMEELAADREMLAELIRWAQSQPKSCDGLFLNILLGDLTGIEGARQVRAAEPHLPIIFTTAECSYAVDFRGPRHRLSHQACRPR